MRGMSHGVSALGLQELVEREGEVRTLVEFLREGMDGVDGRGRWKSLRERLGLKGIGCCGSTWGFRPSTMSVRDDDDDEEEEEEEEVERQLIEAIDVGQIPAENSSDPACVGQIPASTGMNLATALAAERHFRATQDSDGGGGGGEMVGPTSGGTVRTAGTELGTPMRVSLMRLLEESDGVDGEIEKEREGGSDSVCCVCMGRKKGAAFIPCGHTFCRVCSRELWLNRGSCPLCNRSILEILDIF